ncbi:MAG: alpha/beta fold hydrolase [Rickettsiales bacterium]|nr:alpha/beta fold hydrolase [Rickettsiales bacterium]
MSKKIICLTGWGQKFDSLEFIFRDPLFDPIFFATSSLNYSVFDSAIEFFTNVKSSNLHCDILIGWSLGGQLALRLIAQKILNPQLLILIAPPFQMVKDKNIQAAMAPNVFAEFYHNFCKAPNQTLKKFSILSAMNDRNASEIYKNLEIKDDDFGCLKFWLEELKIFSCFNLDFSQMPRTIFFQGAGDTIVHASQAEYFKKRIKDFRLEVFKNCGHAPHLSDVEKFRKIIFAEFQILRR